MKKTNKGFSLVELIIVIAIMAILAAALAPALIRYIDKSRRSSDLSNAGILQSAAQSAAADESAYAEIAAHPGTVLSAAEGAAWATPITAPSFLAEFTSTAGANAPQVKLKKDAPANPVWQVELTNEGGFVVKVSGTELVPNAQAPWKN